MGSYIRQLCLILLAVFMITGCTNTATKPANSSWESGNLDKMFQLEPQQHKTPPPEQEHYTLMFDNMNGYWKHAKSVTVDGVDMNTFVPKDETANKWQERIETTHCQVGQAMTARKYYKDIVQANLKDMCYYSAPKARILWQDKRRLIYEYQVLDCGKKPSKAVIGQIIYTPNNINVISYTVITDYLDPKQRAYMLEIIKSARLL